MSEKFDLPILLNRLREMNYDVQRENENIFLKKDSLASYLENGVLYLILRKVVLTDRKNYLQISFEISQSFILGSVLLILICLLPNVIDLGFSKNLEPLLVAVPIFLVLTLPTAAFIPIGSTIRDFKNILKKM